MTLIYIIIFVAAAALVAALWYIATMNAFARLAVKVEEADSGIEVALTKRFDTLTKMLDREHGPKVFFQADEKKKENVEMAF